MTPRKPLNHAAAREAMVRDQIERRGIRDERLLEALRKVPRHEYVPHSAAGSAYRDGPLSIGFRQTISQPYIVAYMTDALALTGAERVLEIGTGSGYQTAILAELAREVFTIEVIEALGIEAKERLEREGYRNISFRIGTGRDGWPEGAPFDGIIITAAPESDPLHLKDQLVEGGRMVAPVGRFNQVLRCFTRRGDRLVKEDLIDVRFVPLV